MRLMTRRLKVPLIAILIVFFAIFVLFGRGGKETPHTFSTEKETEIYYRYAEIYSEIIEKEGLDPLPQLGEKDAPTPKGDKAKQIAAEEFNVSISELRKILDRVSKSKPTEEELRIFQKYDSRLVEAIDIEAAGGELVDEDKIGREVADSFGITPEKLNNIWTRVYAWQEYERSEK